MRFKTFWNSLSEDDRIILTHSMNGLTQKEIADKMGFADHSAVSKKLKRMKNMFISMDKYKILKCMAHFSSLMSLYK